MDPKFPPLYVNTDYLKVLWWVLCQKIKIVIEIFELFPCAKKIGFFLTYGNGKKRRKNEKNFHDNECFPTSISFVCIVFES